MVGYIGEAHTHSIVWPRPFSPPSLLRVVVVVIVVVVVLYAGILSCLSESRAARATFSCEMWAGEGRLSPPFLAFSQSAAARVAFRHIFPVYDIFYATCALYSIQRIGQRPPTNRVKLRGI